MYKFNTTEKNNKTANDFETKSMLYLMAMREDSKNIDIFIVDCFNDVTGSSDDLKKLWDVQSIGVKSLNPKKIGEASATLFLNYISSISFDYYILFIPKLKTGYLNDENQNIFNFKNIKKAKQDKMILGLIEEYSRRSRIDIDIVDRNIIYKFFNEITFVIADDDNGGYVKNLITFSNKDQIDDIFFIRLFNEIRDMQSAIKNICIDGECINGVEEVLKYNKVLTRKQLESLVISRLVGMDVFSTKSIPIYFTSEIKDYEVDEINDILIECNSQISKTLFNKSIKDEFWRYFENVITLVKENPSLEPREIHEKIPVKSFDRLFTLNEIGSIYFISMIKGGLQ